MSTRTRTATAAARNEEERRKNRKGLIGVAALATSGALVLGLGYAYFSDSLTFSGSATAGTLDITGDLAAEYNEAADDDGVVENFNPGDVLSVSGELSNAGNKSAWVRTLVEGQADANIADNLYVYVGEDVPDWATLKATATGDLANLSGYVGTMADLTNAGFVDAANVSAQSVIIGGTGANAEADGNTDEAGSYASIVVVYFDKASTNEAQGGAFSLDSTVQAVQYGNNVDSSKVVWAPVEKGSISSGTWVAE